jgi:nucleotide-binding universal stress UspA family protein
MKRTGSIEGIMEFTKQNDIDMVVMGSHGATGMKEIFIGSNTEKVVRNSDIPVLVVKNELIISEVENMVYATDLMNKNKESFTEAVKFSQLLNAKMHVVYINTSSKFKTDDYLIDKSKKFLKDIDTSNLSFEVYGAESIEKGILKYAAKKKANLIGISTHGRKGLAHFLNGSISEDLVNHANMPVVTFKI